MDDPLQDWFRELGISLREQEDSTKLRLLRVLLQESGDKPLSVAQIETLYREQFPGDKISETWIRRVIKQLLDVDLIKIESPLAYRKRYKADVNTIMAGIEKLRADTVAQTELGMKTLEDKLKSVKSVDPVSSAQEYVKTLTGRTENVSSRFIKGLDEFNRVIEAAIFSKAGEGDLIRASITFLGPLMEKIPERWKKNFEAVERGAEVRYSIPHTALKLDGLMKSSIPQEWMIATLKQVIDYKKRGLKLDIRVNTGSLKEYQFVGINDESLAFIITEEPLNAAWVTKNFNPDLIKNAITTFDRNWDSCVSLLDMSPDLLSKLGASEESYLASMVEKSKDDSE
jgi:hypothetical protein